MVSNAKNTVQTPDDDLEFDYGQYWFRIALWFAFLVAIVVFLAWRGYHGFVPRGAGCMPYVFASVEAGTIVSPSGRVYLVRYNDAGAMHSGNHWTWIIDFSLLTGYTVIAEGYLDLEQAKNVRKLDIEWKGEVPVIPWNEGRYK